MRVVEEVLDFGFQVGAGASLAFLHVDGQEVGGPGGEGGFAAQLLDVTTVGFRICTRSLPQSATQI